MCTLPRDVWDEEHHEYVRVEANPFPGISSREECDAIIVKISECERDEQILAWEAEDAAVAEGKVNFVQNGGFERGATAGVGESVEEMVAHSMAALHGLTGDATSGEAQWQTDCVEEAAKLSERMDVLKEAMEEAGVKSDAQLRHDEKVERNKQAIQEVCNIKRAEQAASTGGAGKGKGGKGKGGKGKGGKGMSMPITTGNMYGGKGAPAFLTKETVPMPTPPPKTPVAVEVPEVTPPSADALDLGEEAFPALGMSMRKKSNEGKKVVSGGSKAATTNKFMRKAYGCPASR